MPQNFNADFKNHIAITFDDKYMQHACVMLKSLNAFLSVKVKVHCIFNNLTQQNQKLLNKHFAESNLELNFIAFDNTVLPDLPIKQNDHVSSAAFFRIWLPYILPNLKQVLFLDTDIVINRDIKPLLAVELNSFPLAAVPDYMSNEKKINLFMDSDAAYFNSGVMIMNLEYFRQHNLTQQITNFITTHPHLCEFWDQDAINATINGNFYTLDAKYNAQSWHFDPNCNMGYADVAVNPVLIHFTGAGMCKPWFFHNKHPFKRLYYHYLVKTPFKSYLPPDIPRSWRIFRIIRFIAYKYLS